MLLPQHWRWGVSLMLPKTRAIQNERRAAWGGSSQYESVSLKQSGILQIHQHQFPQRARLPNRPHQNYNCITLPWAQTPKHPKLPWVNPPTAVKAVPTQVCRKVTSSVMMPGVDHCIECEAMLKEAQECREKKKQLDQRWLPLSDAVWYLHEASMY